MGLVKTRRLAAMQKARLRGGFGAASSTKAGMKPCLKVDLYGRDKKGKLQGWDIQGK